ncbi:hypothetical protein SprV_0100352900 [Sparganum proliferum]
MVCSPIGTRDRLCHQHVPLVSPLDEDIVQQVTVSRPRVHPGGLLSHRKVKVGVGQDQSVYCSGLKKELAIVIGTAGTMWTQHSSPSSMVCADASIEVTKDNQLIHLRHSREEGVQVLVELVP